MPELPSLSSALLQAQVVIAGVFALGALIAFHEFGHFLVAKLLGIGVRRFSLGVGPPLARRTFRDTEYVVAWLPLGGYVQLVGAHFQETGPDAEEEIDPRRSFARRPPLQRIAVVLAGPLFNLLLAFGLIWALLFLQGEIVSLDESSTRIGYVDVDMPADRAGIRPGDEIVAIDGRDTSSWGDVRDLIQTTDGAPFNLRIARDGELLEVELSAQRVSEQELGDEEGGPRFIIGIEHGDVTYERQPFWRAAELAAKGTALTTWRMVKTLADIVSHGLSPKQIAGPLTIGRHAGATVKDGPFRFLQFVAIISINLALMNLLLPIPLLDGGQFILYAIELIRRRPLSLRKQELLQRVSIVLLLGVMGLALFNDFRNQLDSRRERTAPTAVGEVGEGPGAVDGEAGRGEDASPADEQGVAVDPAGAVPGPAAGEGADLTAAPEPPASGAGESDEMPPPPAPAGAPDEAP